MWIPWMLEDGQGPANKGIAGTHAEPLCTTVTPDNIHRSHNTFLAIAVLTVAFIPNMFSFNGHDRWSHYLAGTWGVTRFHAGWC